MLPFTLQTPGEIMRDVGARARKRRLGLGLTQEEVAERAGMSVATVKRFERIGQIGFAAIVRLSVVLDAEEGLETLFEVPAVMAKTLDEVLLKSARQRGRRRTK